MEQAGQLMQTSLFHLILIVDSLPSEGSGSEDGGIGLRKPAAEHFHLATPEAYDLLFHGSLDRLEKKVSGIGYTSEQDDSLRGAESDEVGELPS